MKKYMPMLAFVIVSAIGLAMTYLIFEAETSAENTRFASIATEAVDRIRQKADQNLSVIAATHSFLNTNGASVSRKEFQTFAMGLVVNSHVSGIQGIGFAQLIKTGDEISAERNLRQNYDFTAHIWPDSDQAFRTPITLLEPQDARNQAALGYDMFSEPIRRAAMEAAASVGKMQASAPVELVQEITEDKQPGFLAYMPLFTPSEMMQGEPGDGKFGSIAGFVYAPFRAGDLHQVALSRPTPVSVLVETIDTTAGGSQLLFRSEGFEERLEEAQNVLKETIDVAGRQWSVSVIEAFPSSHTLLYWRTLILGTVSLLFAAALAVSIRAQMKTSAATQELNQVAQKTIEEKDLMLQEMKHRIKNSIARILAMARQTSNSSENLEEFTTSFTARLQAMANAQDLLTRSKWESADLKTLLTQELEQVFGNDSEQMEVGGPKVRLDERATHALGLVFHELATNAMKYSSIFEEGGSLSITWNTVRRDKETWLELSWVEVSANAVPKPSSKGFGSRLIDASIRGELRGNIQHDFGPTGLKIRIALPLPKPKRKKAPSA
ncbi:CHASE domain-containing protein [Roseibium suaedae]|uniref:histidine kinase n=1 Tax=Roseibium suaedae TaxID=735517 RepID=A0A1M7CZQ2_9HYPH|nr:CHASE domain-containing protein [Roseibium suaedae]SHL72771.1 sensor domain CHASE1-containing protein [Roseibium suaedae]